MMRITPEYKTLNQEMHREGKFRGGQTLRHKDAIRDFAKALGAATVLDYGCGPALLSGVMDVTNYDPCVPKYSSEPDPHDLVVCLDVLEHVEPQCLDAVMGHLRSKATKGAYLCIATRPDSVKTLPDGSNPHRIVKPAGWWEAEVSKRFLVHRKHNRGNRDVVFWCTLSA